MYLLIFFLAISIIFYFSGILEKSEKYAYKRMRITSDAFDNGELIPEKYTCNGENISPPLRWKDFPIDTKSFVLLFEDPDTSPRAFVHWLLYNIPNTANSIKENVPSKERLSRGAIHGTNGYGDIGYSGPCPKEGLHHYKFRILALDVHLNTERGLNKFEVLKRCKNHVLAEGVLIGRYRRKS